MPPTKKKTSKPVSRVRDKASGVVGEFPLAEEDYFTSAVTTPHGHHGATDDEQSAVRMIQQQIGRPVTGVMSIDDTIAISHWRAERRLGHGTFVDRRAWEQMQATPMDES